MARRKIILENGKEFYGEGFGGRSDAVCELVFNSSVVGYQEIISDPTYTNQAVIMTYPLIGNYGMTDEDYETKIPTVGGLIVREYNDVPSNFRYTKTLSEILEDYNIPGICEVDTRMLTRIIRNEGSMKVMITDIGTPLEDAVKKLRETVLPKDSVARVSCRKKWYSRTPNHKYNVVAVDCGIKQNIIRKLNERACNVTVVPYNTTAEDILALSPDGLIISNGPGCPEDVSPVINLIKSLKGKIPMFGIGLGHQLIALACGGKVEKMKFGHRGGYPVRDVRTGKIFVAAQNHSYTVIPASLVGTGLEITHTNVVDSTVEGCVNTDCKIITAQFQPEAAPGAQDCYYLFDDFIKML